MDKPAIPVGAATTALEHAHQALHTDFCPWANRYVYWLKNPFWVLLAALLTALACGVYVSQTLLAVAGLLLAVLVLAVLWPLLGVRGLECRVRFEQTRGREGLPTAVEIEIVNRRPWPVWGLSLTKGFVARDDAESAAGQGGIALAGVGGWSRTVVPWSFVPPTRGVYPLEPSRIETGFPFGLYRAGKAVEVRNELIVWPAAARLDTLPDAVEIESHEDRTSDRRAGSVGDLLGTRPFRQGDSLRSIHWGQSARHGNLIVCERQVPVACAMRLVLDLDPASHGPRDAARGVDPEGSLERLLRAAASIVESMHAQHAHVECLVGHEVLTVGAPASDLRRCLDALARIPARGIDACHDHGLCCSPGSRHRAMSEFLLTTPLGFSRQLHDRHWSGNHHYVVIGSTSAPAPADCATHTHCACRPWLELDGSRDVVEQLPRDWRRACRVA
jgi:uncharacterized protein (DUF58 family)